MSVAPAPPQQWAGPGLNMRVEVSPKKQKLVLPQPLLTRTVSEEKREVLERVAENEASERASKQRFDTAASNALIAAVNQHQRLAAADGAKSSSSSAAAAAGAAGSSGSGGGGGLVTSIVTSIRGSGVSSKEEKTSNPRLTIPIERLYELIRAVQTEDEVVRDAQASVMRQHCGEELNEILIDEENKRELALQRLRRERNKQTEQFSELRLKLESKQFSAVRALVESSTTQLSELRIAEMTKRETEVAALAKQKAKQAEEFSLTRLQLEKQAEQQITELKSKQALLQKSMIGKLIPGEEKILAANGYHVFTLNAKSIETLGSTAEYHFRYAESQFLRLAQGQPYHVTEVDYVVNAPLVKAFEKRCNELKSKRGPGEGGATILGFHGTSSAAIDGIIKTNFSVAKLGSNTGDQGFFGAGIYFSEYTGVSLGYNKDTSRMLLSKVLIGKQWKCPGMCTGAPLKSGYDSHLSPDGTEVVIYDNHQILPCYIVHYANNAARLTPAPPVMYSAYTPPPVAAAPAASGGFFSSIMSYAGYGSAASSAAAPAPIPAYYAPPPPMPAVKPWVKNKSPYKSKRKGKPAFH